MKSGIPRASVSVTPPTLLHSSRSTYRQLERGALNLYRHRVSGLYHGFHKVAGKRRCLSLKTADRKTAERKLGEWLRDLGEVDASNPDATLAMLLENFQAVRAAKSKSTARTEGGILKEFRASFRKPTSTYVSRVKPSDLATWVPGSSEQTRIHL